MLPSEDLVQARGTKKCAIRLGCRHVSVGTEGKRRGAQTDPVSSGLMRVQFSCQFAFNVPSSETRSVQDCTSTKRASHRSAPNDDDDGPHDGMSTHERAEIVRLANRLHE